MNQSQQSGAPDKPGRSGRFRIGRLEPRIAPAVLQINGGGHVPKGNANGVSASNPAGHQPPGQNR